jgi:hypothetical protein
MGIRRAQFLRVLALPKDEASKEPEQHWECRMDSVEVSDMNVTGFTQI